MLVDPALFEGVLRSTPIGSIRGRVIEVLGPVIKVELEGVLTGDFVSIERDCGALLAQVVGFSGESVVVAPFGLPLGIGPGAGAEIIGQQPSITVGPHLLGSVVDGLGKIQAKIPASSIPGEAFASREMPLYGNPPSPLARHEITEPFVTGIRSIDAFLTIAVGQRISVFAEPGVGKSTLMTLTARSSSAAVNVFGLIGERGREVGDFLRELELRGVRGRSIVVASTSDEPAPMRVSAALTATAIAEYFRDCGLNVLLQVDSLTRLLRALREIGLAAGEMPVRRGYPASVYAQLPRLIERTGMGTRGSITALYTVLLAGESEEDPMVEEIKGLTDGHFVLRRELAERGIYPAIDVLASISRLMPRVQPRVAGRNIGEGIAHARRLLARLRDDQDLALLNPEGIDPELRQALASKDALEKFLTQLPDEVSSIEATISSIERLGFV